jgi:hypothetical protein
MEVQEISSRVDYALQQSKGGIILDEYQKSLYLTKAQSLFVEAMLAQYEYGDALRHVLGNLIITSDDATITDDGDSFYSLVPNEDILSILYEEINSLHIPIIPLDYNDIHDARVNPFRKPYKNLAYRITGNKKLTIFSSEIVVKYLYIYCKIPKPIVLETIPTELAIQEVETELTSELPYDSVLKVIDLAVQEVLKDIQRINPPKQVKEEVKK